VSFDCRTSPIYLLLELFPVRNESGILDILVHRFTDPSVPISKRSFLEDVRDHMDDVVLLGKLKTLALLLGDKLLRR
jgi:hypothetical protein